MSVDTIARTAAPVVSYPASLAPVPTPYCPGCTHGIAHRLAADVIDALAAAGDQVTDVPVGLLEAQQGLLQVDDVDAVALGGVDDQLALGGLDGPAVDGDADRRRRGGLGRVGHYSAPTVGGVER